jgi:hypothetical protein
VIVVGAVLLHGWIRAGREGIFRFAENERRYTRAVAVARRLPESAILVSVSHSGTLNLYAQRDVLRWDVVHAPQIDRIVATLTAAHHSLYFVGDPFEVDGFKQKFQGQNVVGAFIPERTSDLDGAFIVDLSGR